MPSPRSTHDLLGPLAPLRARLTAGAALALHAALAPTARTLVALAATLAAATTAHADTDQIHVAVGQKKFVTLPDMASSVKIDKSGVITVDKGETRGVITVTGKDQGSTSLFVTLENGQTIEYTVTVAAKGTTHGLDAVIAALKPVTGIAVEARSGRLYLKGVVSNRQDKQLIADLKAENPGLIVDGTEKEIYESNTVVRTINRVLAENDLGNMQAHAYGQHIVLEGSARDEQQLTLAMRIAKSMYPTIEDSVSKTANGAPSLSIEVMFVETQKKNDKTFGISGLQDAFRGDKAPAVGTGAASAGLKPLTGTRTHGKASLIWQVGPLNAFLKMIETKSASRVLSNPRLVARSGQEATFQSGGTFYLASSARDGQGNAVPELLPINYGIELAILPKLDAIGQIDSKIRTSISDIGPTVATQPSITRSAVETAVTIKNGQSILLSGLARKTDSKRVERVPFLADIPLVGELFKTRNLQSDETELLVIVTMRRVGGTDDRSSAASQLYDKAADDVEFSVFD